MSDRILQFRQIAQYQREDAAIPGSVALLQWGEAGSPYVSIEAADLVASALAGGGRFQINAASGAIVFGDGVTNAGTINMAAGEFIFSEPIRVSAVNAAFIDAPSITVAGVPVATSSDLAAVAAAVVTSFNFRTGDVQLELPDVLRAGGAPIRDAHFGGWITAPSVWDTRANDDTVATTNWVHRAIHDTGVSSFNCRTGCVTLTTADVNAAYATLDGTYPTAPNPALGDASGRIATTLFVDESMADLESQINQDIQNAIPGSLAAYAPLASPQFTGVPTAPTANPGTSTGQLATTSFVQHAVTAGTAGVASFNTRTGAVVLMAADVTGVGGALLAGPAFTGVPTAPTAAPATNTTQLATTAFVTAAVAAIGAGVTSFNGRSGVVTLTTADVTGAGGAPVAGPNFTGVVTAPTPAPATNSTVVATTAYVTAALAALGTPVTSFNGRSGAVTLQANDVSAVGGAMVASPTFTGVPAAPTAAPATNTTQLATCAFVTAAVAGAVAGVTSFNARTGAVTLVTADVTGAGGAPIASPNLTGVPTAPTAAQTSSDTTLATTAFVHAAITAQTLVSSFNSRTGAVTLSSADVSAAGGALLASPTFTGTPAAPTAAPATNTTQLATTAFVTNAVTTGTVTSFNGRNGVVTLTGTDLTGAGGALLASPSFTGTPLAPTATAGTSNTQIATTAFVAAAVTAGAVTSFNTRTGAITLTAADITGAGGALLASPTFTGTPAGPTAAPGTNTTQLATTAFVQAAAAVPPVLRSYLAGLTLSTTGSSATFSVAAGVAADSINAHMMALNAAISKTAAAWAVGTGNGALDTGTIAASTWYHVFLIERTDLTAVDVLVSLSPTAPTMPANYSFFRRIGSMKTNASGQWTLFHQLGDEFLWDVTVNDAASITVGTTAVLTTLSVPPGVQVKAFIRSNGSVTSGTALILFSSPDEAASAAGTPAGNWTINAMAAGNAYPMMQEIRTSTSAQVRTISSAAGSSVTMDTYGWRDSRGKDA